ncbi:hypothetical protein LOTGIDRAFT_227961 [Lottia gigantea]|uniref:Ion transport domain-containing protein n=1 Tax=Lottia gigantea TaxID=225164 RepID=V4AM99_LOTGI|nr:hypothetical protein LOTGIDRAFT_227961 [Lottia gigantea]ESP05324.1 hypothetical protein LOTGIDRAFT_227961 [Lottia gigantea]
MDTRTSDWWRSCMGRLESKLYGVCIETSVITLTTISVLAVTGELLIGLKIIQEPPDNGKKIEEKTQRTNSTSEKNDYVQGEDNLTLNIFIANCVFRYTSLVIAALFLLEICLKILARGRSFFVFPWQIFDGLVILVTFGIEITFIFVKLPEPYWEAMTYVVILRYWRIPPVCNIRANVRLIEFNQELESWRAAKQKVDEKCKNLQYELDKIKIENMGINKTNGHIPGVKEIEDKGMSFLILFYDSMLLSTCATGQQEKKILENIPLRFSGFTDKQIEGLTLNGIIKTSHQNSHNTTQIEDETDSKIVRENKNNVNKMDIAIKVKSVNFDMSFKNEISGSPSPSRKRPTESTKINRYQRTDSESSISYEAAEEEVVVQIENAIQSELQNSDDGVYLISDDSEVKDSYAYVNGSFDDEIDDLVLRKDLQVMADIDGTKTYRSADGIPMTSL